MNKLKRTVVVLCVGVLICGGVVLSVIGLGQSAFAEGVSSTQMLQKAQILNMRHCINDFNFFKTELSEDDYNGKDGIKGAYKGILDSGNQTGGYIYIPNQVDNSVGNGWHETPSITCKDLFNGTSKLQNIFSLFGKSSHPPLTDLGYDLDSSANDGSIEGCLYFDYEYSGDDKMPRSGRTNKVCMTVGSNGNIDNNGRVCSNIKDEGGANGPLKLDCNPNDNSIRLRSTDPFVNTGGSIAEFSGSTSWQSGVRREFVNNVVNALGEGGVLNELYGYKVSSDPFHFDETKYDGKIKATYNKGQAANRILNYLTGSTNWSNWSFNTKDKYYLYTAYLNNELSKSGSSLRYGECGNKTTAREKSDSGIAVRNGDKWCALMNVDSVRTKYNAPSSSGGMLMPTSFIDVMKALMDLDYDYLEEQGVEIGAITGDGTITNPVESGNNSSNSSNGSNSSGGGDSNTSLCQSAAKSLGWIVCPVISGASDALEGIYKAAIEPFLGIDANMLSTDGSNSSVYGAWKTFRTSTNVIFAIMFAVVIFAQVTGLGISNYNVKKILPRLIAVVILVNVSFFLCQLLVDLSNLVGFSLNKTFADLASSVSIGSDAGVSGYTLSEIVGSLSATALSAAAIGGAGLLAVATWEIWLFPFLLAVLGCIVGVLFFFIILGARQAGVIVLIAISPLAIICYALPNTKSFFDKWWKVFSALLLVYPICGALMGGGQFASALLVSSSTGFLNLLIAMLVSVVPFFFIPSILKGAFAGLGNLGMKISNFGQRLGSGAQSSIRNTEGYRDLRRQQQMRYDARVAENLLKKQASGKRLRKDQVRRLQRHGAAYARAAYEDQRAGVNAETGDFNLPGTQSRLLMEQELRDQRDTTAVKNQQALYESGNVVGHYNGADFNVDPNSLDTIGDEYESQLNTLRTAIANGDTNARREALTKVKALHNILSKTDSGRGIVQNRMSKMMMEDGAELAGADGQETALSLAAGHLMHEFGDTYKKANRGMHAMLGDLSQRQYSRSLTGGNSFEEVSLGQDARTGKERFSYRSSLYDTAGLGSYNPQSFGDADEEALSRIGAKIGTMSETDASTAAALANGALSGKNSTQLQEKVRRNFERIATGAYSRGALGRSIDASTPTLGSSLLTQAESGTISSLIGRIQSTDPGARMSDDDVRNLAENTRRALESGAVVKDADGLQQILTAARSRGVRGIDGDEFRQVESRDFRVRHGDNTDSGSSGDDSTIDIVNNLSDADMERLRRERERRDRGRN